MTSNHANNCITTDARKANEEEHEFLQHYKRCERDNEREHVRSIVIIRMRYMFKYKQHFKST